MEGSIDPGNSFMVVRYKVVFVGDVSVGKTSIMNRFMGDGFKDDYDATIGVDFATKTISYNENTMKLQIWDSAGQERYKALIPSYVRGASIVFIVYDVSNRETFTGLGSWISFIKDVNTDNSLIILVGNKIDLNRQISTKEGEALARQENLMFYEVSAKSGSNINNMMYSCIVNLPFFTQFGNIDKKRVVEDLIRINSEENKGDYNGPTNPNDSKVVNNPNMNNINPTPGLNVQGVNNLDQRTREIMIQKKKCAC